MSQRKCVRIEHFYYSFNEGQKKKMKYSRDKCCAVASLCKDVFICLNIKIQFQSRLAHSCNCNAALALPEPIPGSVEHRTLCPLTAGSSGGANHCGYLWGKLGRWATQMPGSGLCFCSIYGWSDLWHLPWLWSRLSNRLQSRVQV